MIDRRGKHGNHLKGNQHPKPGLKHGQKGTRLYRIWSGMKMRCRQHKDYENISYHSLWEDFEPFMEWAIESGYKDNLTLERDNVFGNYEPSNCSWIPLEDQLKNRKNSVIWTIDGIDYESSIRASKELAVSKVMIQKWCKGYKIKVNGKEYSYPPKQNCSWRLRYDN